MSSILIQLRHNKLLNRTINTFQFIFNLFSGLERVHNSHFYYFIYQRARQVPRPVGLFTGV